MDLKIAPSLFHDRRKLCVHSSFLLFSWQLDETKKVIHLQTSNVIAQRQYFYLSTKDSEE